MKTFIDELLTHLRDGQMSLPEVAQQLLSMSGSRATIRQHLNQAVQNGMLDSAAAEQLQQALTPGSATPAPQPVVTNAAANDHDSTLLRTIHAQPEESSTLVPNPQGVANAYGTDSIPASHPKTEIIHENLGAALGTRNETAVTPVQLVPGAIIKQRFILKERIGQGGMGVVFAAIDRRKTEARDPNPLVAIKILDAELARYDKAWMALQREARKAQSLAHPNIVTVYDFDRDGDTAYMTMALLEGSSLESYVRDARKQTPDPGRIWPIVRGMAEGLAYAHRNGIVHADLKPGNVFVTHDHQVKLLDFGIARAIPAFAERQKVKDIFDPVSLGAYTATYATAEMMQAGDPDPSDDVYALGLITYELLTGNHPYQRQSAVDAQKNGLKPQPVKGLTARQWRVLERSLRFGRHERPQDAATFLRELTGISRLQHAMIAGLATLTLVAGYFAWQSYAESGPAISFSSLPAATQQQFQQHMQTGDKLRSFYQHDHNLLALQDAVDQYAKAYALHPRNRDATHALERCADAALQALQNQPEARRQMAQAISERSEYLASYAPVQKALK